MEEIMLTAKYPIIDTKEFVEVFIGVPKPADADYYTTCKISGADYEKQFVVWGIDPIQSIWIALRQIRVEIIEFERLKNLKCEYSFFVGAVHEQFPTILEP